MPTKPDQIRSESHPLIEASNGHKRPSDLSFFFATALPRCDPCTHTFCIFLSCLPPTLSSPPRFPAHFPSRDCHLPFPPVDWIFSRCHRHGGCSPSPGFCHLSKTRCHFHSPSHPSPPLSPHPCFLASISYRAELCVRERVCQRLVCNPDSLQPKSILFEIWSIMETFLPTPTFHFHISSSLLPPLFSLYDTFPFRSPLSNQENMMQKRGENTFSDIISCVHCRTMLKERGICIIFQRQCVQVLLERARLSH